MTQLRAGTSADFSNSLAAEMEAAMKVEWQNVKGSPLPGGAGEEDRRILFVAVARGLLKFLEDHKHDTLTTASSGGANHTHTMEWDYQ
jgi:hypothetical protein